MAINVFEGARRASKLVIAIWLIIYIGTLLAMFSDRGFSNFDIIELMVLVGILFGGVLLILAFTWAIGWIMRGFMGVPKGQDKK